MEMINAFIINDFNLSKNIKIKINDITMQLY